VIVFWSQKTVSGADLVMPSGPIDTDHESARRSGSYGYHFYGRFHDRSWTRARPPQDLRQTQKTSGIGPFHDVFCDQKTIKASDVGRIAAPESSAG
jgi:hypothetical protein